MEAARREENQQVMKVLEALKQASLELQTNPTSIKSADSSSSPIKALLELENEAENILTNDPHLSNLSTQLLNLKSLVSNFNRLEGHSIRSFLRRRVNSHEIARVARSIESEIQAWIDRETVENLIKSLQEGSIDEEEKLNWLTQFEARVSQGFNRDLQESVLKSKVFNVLESVLCDPKCSKRVREQSAFAVCALVKFNKDVFVGEVLMGATIRALVSMGSPCSIQVLCSLIRSIKSPLVDEIEIPKIVNFLNCQDEAVKVMAFDCILEIGHFGRKEAVEAMLEEGVVKKLVELQKSELGGDLIDMGRFEETDSNSTIRVEGVQGGEANGKVESRERRFLERRPYASCVARFAIQLEVGEGLRQRERRAFKGEILRRVREACVSDAQASTIIAEVLWGSSP